MKYIIEGDYFDCLYHDGCFYIWDTWGTLFVVDFDVKLPEGEKDFTHCTFQYDNRVVHSYVKKQVRSKGGILPLDVVISGKYLYAAMEDAVYKCGVSYTSIKRGISILDSHEILSVRCVSMAVDDLGFVSVAAESDGVFEIYDHKNYAISKWDHSVKDVEKGVYQVTRRYTRKVDYINSNILTFDDSWTENVCNFKIAARRWTDGKIRRSLINSKKDNLPALREQFPMSVLPFDRTKVESHYYVPRKHSVGGLLEVASIPRKMETGAFGTVTESKKEVLVELKNGSIIRFEGPITRSRILSGKSKKDLLMIVFDDRIEVTDFADELSGTKACPLIYNHGK